MAIDYVYLNDALTIVRFRKRTLRQWSDAAQISLLVMLLKVGGCFDVGLADVDPEDDRGIFVVKAVEQIPNGREARSSTAIHLKMGIGDKQLSSHTNEMDLS